MGQLIADPFVDNQNSTVKTLSDTMGAGDFYSYTPSGVYTVVTSTSLPHRSSTCIRATAGTGSSSVQIRAMNPSLSAVIADGEKLTAQVNPGSVLTGSYYVKGITSYGPSAGYTVAFYDSNNDFISQSANLTAVTITADWQQVSVGTITVPAKAAFVVMTANAQASVDSTSVVDFDTFTLVQTVTLYVTNTGFRFPYQRWT